MTTVKHIPVKKKKAESQHDEAHTPETPASAEQTEQSNASISVTDPKPSVPEKKEEQPQAAETLVAIETTDETIQISQSPPPSDQKDQKQKQVSHDTASEDAAIAAETKTVNVNVAAAETPDPQKDTFLSEGIDMPLEKSSRKFMLIGIIAVVAITVGLISYIFFISKTKQEESSQAETTAIETPAPAKEVKPQLDRSEITFEVLNGSGVSGAAAKAAEKIKSLGYAVIKVGNADTSNYKNTSLYISKDITNLSSLILEDVQLEYKKATLSGDLKSSTASARIIIGKD